jgi:hypothetical protein
MQLSLQNGMLRVGTIVLAAVIALGVGLIWTSPAWAQSEKAPVEFVSMREEVRAAGLAAAAELLGMTPDELSDQLWGGRTLAELAEEAGVTLREVRAAVEEATQAARQSRIKEFVAKQVEAGRISQEQADWINEGIDNGWFGRLFREARQFDGFRHGFSRFGRGHGMGIGHMRPERMLGIR